MAFPSWRLSLLLQVHQQWFTGYSCISIDGQNAKILFTGRTMARDNKWELILSRPGETNALGRMRRFLSKLVFNLGIWSPYSSLYFILINISHQANRGPQVHGLHNLWTSLNQALRRPYIWRIHEASKMSRIGTTIGFISTWLGKTTTIKSSQSEIKPTKSTP